MLIVKSRTKPTITYLFESDITPLNADKIEKFYKDPCVIELSLVLSAKSPPIDQEPYDTLEKIMKDCAHPELNTAYNDSYGSFTTFLKLLGVTEETYRIHTVRKT